MRMADGTTFEPSEAHWRIWTPDRPEVEYSWDDVKLLMMLEPTLDVVEGVFGPPGSKGGMPIRGLRFTDLSDLVVEVPLPLPLAREMGGLLAQSKIEVAGSVPTSLVLADRLARRARRGGSE
jgi:hypothetical protein